MKERRHGLSINHRRLITGISISGIAALALTACGGDGGESGGDGTDEIVTEELRIAYSSQPPTLDPAASTAIGTRDIARNAFEQLLAADSEGQLHGVLAESWEEHDDGSVTFTIRDDVTFHDGSDLTAEDVAASLRRGFELHPLGQQYFEGAEVTVDDDYTLTLTVPEPMFITLNLLAGPVHTPVMPAAIAEEAPPEGASEIVGTGPYQLVEWQADQYAHFEIFEDYVPKDGPDEGMTGDRSGTYESMYFEFVTDPSTRLNGMLTGEYDMAKEIPYDNYSQLESADDVEAYIGEGEFLMFVYNKAEGLMADQEMRHALWSAVDVEDVLIAAYSDEQFYTMNGSLVAEDNPWYTDAGLEGYGDEPDLEEARRLLEEAGYDGEPVRIVASQEYQHHYDAAIMVEQQLSEAGVNVDLIVPDWPTLLDIRADPSGYELFVTHSNPEVMPIQHPFLFPSWPGWTEDEDIAEQLDNITYAQSEEEALAAADDLQAAVYEYLPVMKFGEMTNIMAHRSDLQGFENIPGTGDIFYRVRPTE